MFGRRACIPPLAAALALGECLLALASRNHRVGRIEPDEDGNYSMGRDESDVEDQYSDLESFRYFTEEMVSGQHQAVVTCQDPARYQVECLSWQHLCPDSGRPQPSIFDDFMTEWCPKTCGLCENDKVADDLEVSLDAQQRDEGHTCKSHMVSRRRSTGDLCSCRRRSNAKGLSPGWACKGDHIEWEGFNTDENSEKPVFCCCKEGECTYESVRRGDSVQHFNLRERNGTWCCKNKFGDRDSGNCPYYSGYRHREELDMCRHPYVEPSIHACSDRVHRWLSDINWYKLVTGWEYQQISYESYIPCMVSQFKHTRGYMLTMKNALASISMENPMRGFIISLPECSGLTGKDLVKSVDIAYEKQCPFGLPNSAYKPDLVSDGACSYDPLDRTINLQGSMMCVEGHRCACPVFEKTNTVVAPARH